MLTTTSVRSRGTLVVGIVVAVLASPLRVEADSGFITSTDCADGACDVTAHTPARGPVASDVPTGEGSGDANGESGPACAIPDVEFAQSGLEGPHQMPPGLAECEAISSGTGAEVFDPAVLAEQARAVMRLPAPDIGTAPALGKPRFVNLPSWMWVDAAEWGPVSATASVSAGSVTVLATPDRVVWDTGDGHEVVCAGPGTVFSEAVYREEGSPDCGHTYTTLPEAGAGATVDVRAVWEWGVSWSSSDGRGGDLDDLSTSSTVAVPVSEIHHVITHVR
ncbi:hypothetical protein DFP74_0558 [Nocardiopsis sp. Huas11]|uniref:hypothetical protein n=1 Tax=Nocardiopsis sp. Huas11 TaxID=2183912 RepID=UPI000EB0EBAF|nr:hypothetical protein [Nocardiopsis sp. Huas11]RKS04978.1 hypothetical protein DFP74_0558 [Nocardiopsis sp. Huas11]